MTNRCKTRLPAFSPISSFSMRTASPRVACTGRAFPRSFLRVTIHAQNLKAKAVRSCFLVLCASRLRGLVLRVQGLIWEWVKLQQAASQLAIDNGETPAKFDMAAVREELHSKYPDLANNKVRHKLDAWLQRSSFPLVLAGQARFNGRRG